MYVITQAEYIEGYKIKLTFDDGQQRLADFYPFLSNNSHPLVNKYLDLELFKQFYIEGWAIRWGDNECDLDPYEIYYGEFEASDSPYQKDIIAAKKQLRMKTAVQRTSKRRKVVTL